MTSILTAPAGFIIWLRCALALIVLMVAVGGLTRLTESGLSIVEWKLLSGVFPPLTDAGWHAEFTAYQATPEFQQKNSYMQVQDFKRIFWLEYVHRLLGRAIGLFFLGAAIYYTVRRTLPTSYLKRIWIMLGMVCMQGVVGWYMVKSGLVDQPWVSPYRLGFHLLLAIAIFGYAYWTLLLAQSPERARVSRSLGWGVLAMIMIQILFGAFVAGLDAGYIYNSFPLMDGQIIPVDMWALQPRYRNIAEHIASVQFVHRWYAFIVLAAIIWQWVRHKNASALWVMVTAMLQVLLGIATLLSVVHIALASFHQLVALLLVMMQLRHIYSPKVITSHT